MKRMTAIKTAYLAGIIEGEGCISLATARSGARYPRLVVSMSDKDVVRRLHQFTGCGSILIVQPKYPQAKTQYRWQVGRSEDVIDIITAIRPYMGKRRKAKIDEVVATRTILTYGRK